MAHATLGLCTFLCACVAGAPPRARAPEKAGGAPPEEATFRYELTAAPAAEELWVEIELPPGVEQLRALGRIEPFIDNVEVALAAGKAWQRVAAGDDGWPLPGCSQSACRARYRVSLGRAARDLGDQDLALAYRGAFLSPASSWLLTPERIPAGARYRLSVRMPPGVAFVTGTLLDDRAPGAYGGFVADLDDAPYAAFGPLSVKRLALPGGSLDIAMSPGDTALPRADIERWAETQSRAVASYFGRFAIPHAAVFFLLRGGRGIGSGRTTGNGGGAVMVSLGERSTMADLAEDWVLVHELVHVSFPDVHQSWAEEGLATYVEPLIRVRAGLLDADSVWRDLIRGLPQGQPEAGDKGLDRTDTWGRRYWGGALYWFVADVEIRRQTGNARSLDDALRRIVAQGGNVSVSWSLDRALQEGDGAVGGTVLRDLRRRLGGAPVKVDLDALWKELGVRLEEGRIAYDDGAPLAGVRRGIMSTAERGGP